MQTFLDVLSPAIVAANIVFATLTALFGIPQLDLRRKIGKPEKERKGREKKRKKDKKDRKTARPIPIEFLVTAFGRRKLTGFCESVQEKTVRVSVHLMVVTLYL